VQLATGAFASGFPAESGHGDQRADEEGLFVEELSQAGADLAVFGREMGAVAHRVSFLYLIYINISALRPNSQALFNANLLKIGNIPLSIEFTESYS
jgi:hypothetical protein